MAVRYLDKVHAFATNNTLDAVTDEQVAKVAPLQFIPAPVSTKKPLPLLLRESSDETDVYVMVGDSKICLTTRKAHPPVAVFGVSKDFGLDVKFETTLSPERNSVVTRFEWTAVDIWIRDPQPNVTYSLVRQ